MFIWLFLFYVSFTPWDEIMLSAAVAKTARHLVCVYRPCKESISKEMNDDDYLNLHSMTKLSAFRK